MMLQSKTTMMTLSLLLAFGLSACDRPGSAERAGEKIDESVEKYEEKMSDQAAESGQAWDDTEITTKVKADLLAEPGLSSMQISVDTVGGVVTLTGTVDSQANSDKARTRAMAIDGVRNVVNKLTVTPAQ